MGIQVTFEFKDLEKELRDEDTIIINISKFEDEKYNPNTGKIVTSNHTYYSLELNGVYLGTSSELNGTYWFDNKNINMESRDILDDRGITYTRS